MKKYPNEFLKSPNHIWKSTMQVMKNLFACNICSESFTTATALVNHVKDDHEENKPNEKEKSIKSQKSVETLLKSNLL